MQDASWAQQANLITENILAAIQKEKLQMIQQVENTKLNILQSLERFRLPMREERVTPKIGNKYTCSIQ